MTEHYAAVTRREDRNTWYCDGPGTKMAYYVTTLPTNCNIFDSEENAKKVAHLMNLAYEQGRHAAQIEIRKALGL